MKKIILYVLALGLAMTSGTAKAQQKADVNFIKQDMPAAVKEAKATHKLVFVDCYTSWCSPCKWMADYVFKQDSVATFYNSHFVNLEMDMEKGEGPSYSKKYGVQVFPTYLFLDENGNLVHKATSRMEAAQFIDQGRRAISNNRSSSILAKKYEAGDRSLFTMLNYTEVLQRLNRGKADTIKQELIANLTDKQLKTALGWQVISELATNVDGKLFLFMKKNENYFRATYGDEAVDRVTGRCLLRKIYGLSRDKDNKKAFFNTLNQLKSLPEYEHKSDASKAELDYYISHNDLRSFSKYAEIYASSFLKKDDATLSFIARRAAYADNKDFLKPAYQLAKQAVKISPEDYSNQGTLAEICFELGNKKEAVQAAEKAYQLSLKDSSKIQKIALKLLDKTKNM